MIFVTKSAVTHLSDLGDFLLSFGLCLSSFKWEKSIIVLFPCLPRPTGDLWLSWRTLASFEGNERSLFLIVLLLLPLQRQVEGLILYRLIEEKRGAETHLVRLRCFWRLELSHLKHPGGWFSSSQPVSGDIGPWRPQRSHTGGGTSVSGPVSLNVRLAASLLLSSLTNISQTPTLTSLHKHIYTGCPQKNCFSLI